MICEARTERAGPACCTGEVAVLTGAGVDDDEIIGAVTGGRGERGWSLQTHRI